ncbi:MAG: hypothetical protein IJI53_08055 [Clostridia bacterium]|nr:hypothetical protein [Clostridia bacterium]
MCLEVAMLGVAYFILFLHCGVIITFSLFPRKPVVVRCWLGACLGVVLMMWLPALFAFIWNFSYLSHVAAMLLLMTITAAAYFTRDRADWAAWDERDEKLVKLLLFVALPLTLVTAWLHWTHTIRPMADGTLHVGQSTYGDLPLHLAITSSLRNASFPPDYNILPGELLAYPFLADSLSASFMLLGCSLRAAILIPGIFMTALVFAGYCILAERMADTWKGALLAALFFFLNGGLGFFYMLDMQGAALGTSGNNELQSVAGLWNRIQLVVNGWYQTPANHAEFGTYNLRWSNVIVDMMVPQRTTLAGWAEVIPCLYLLYDALRPEIPWGMELVDGDRGPTAVWHKREMDWRQGAVLGIWAGTLPMVNTHCFLALGLISAGWMAYDLVSSRHHIKNALLFWAAYGLIAVAVAAPQLFTWTFNQAIGNSRFLQFHFNWVNNTGSGLRDGYLWFYLKNIGLPFLLILLSLLEKNEKRRFIACGAFVVFLVAEFVQIQPNEYDNNKLFYIWYMLCAVLAADYGLELLGRLKGLRAKPVVAALCCVLCFSTGALAVAREWKSDYEMFSKDAVEAAAFVEENTDQHAMFLTDYSWHINFVSSLAGRNIVCGPDTWLYYHGYNTSERKSDIARFYADPENSLDVLDKYGVDYILVSNTERARYQVNEDALNRLFPVFYQSDWGGIMIYSVGSL